MSVTIFNQPDFTSQDAATYKAAIDSSMAVLARAAQSFAPHQQSTPDMTVRLDAGVIPGLAILPTEVSAQNTGTITAPSTNPRKDIIYVDQSSGTVGVAIGTEDASPSDPAVPAGKIAVARINLVVSQSSIVNNDLDDLRNFNYLGLAALPYDIAFAGGYDLSMVKEDIEVQTYGELVMSRSGSIVGESGYIDTAPTGTAAIIDILKNGTTVYTTKPQFAASANTLTAGTLKTDGTEDFSPGDRITFKVTQKGSSEPGEGLRFTVKGEV